jgi:3-hydroxyisobutyrate dehydrogenase
VIRRVVCVLGAGIMASGMIRNLARQEFELRLFSRTRARLEPFAHLPTVRIFESPASAAAGADVVISSVADDEASRSIWLGSTGAFAALSRGRIVVETSTLSRPWIDAWVAEAIGRNLRPLDCPVTGSKRGADAGDLFAFVGGDRATAMEAWTVLSAFCSDWRHMGAAGQATRFKLIYNLLGAGIGAILAEALAMVDESGLSAPDALSIFKASSWSAEAAKSKGDAMTARDHSDVSYRMELFRKDIRYALGDGLMRERYPLSIEIETLYARAISLGLGQLDISAIREVVG